MSSWRLWTRMLLVRHLKGWVHSYPLARVLWAAMPWIYRKKLQRTSWILNVVSMSVLQKQAKPQLIFVNFPCKRLLGISGDFWDTVPDNQTSECFKKYRSSRCLIIRSFKTSAGEWWFCGPRRAFGGCQTTERGATTRCLEYGACIVLKILHFHWHGITGSPGPPGTWSEWNNTDWTIQWWKTSIFLFLTLWADVFFLKEIASKRRRLAKATEDLEDLKSRFEGLRWGFGWIGGDSSRMIGLKWGKMVEPLNLIFSWGFQALPLVYQPTYDSLGVAQNILKRPGCRQSPVNKAAIFWANMNLLWGGLESEWFHQNVKVMSWAEVSEWLPSISKSSIHTSGC